MEWTGGCLCGDVHYRANVEPEWVGNCHCTICRKVSGAAFGTMAAFPRDGFEWTKGTPTYYQSSEKAKRGFCARCGSTLTWETSNIFSIFVGSLDRPEAMKPNGDFYTTTCLPWVKLDDDLPRFPGPDTTQWPGSKPGI